MGEAEKDHEDKGFPTVQLHTEFRLECANSGRLAGFSTPVAFIEDERERERERETASERESFLVRRGQWCACNFLPPATVGGAQCARQRGNSSSP